MNALATCDHTDEFDSIALRKKTLHPFPLMKCGGIVLDYHCVRLKTAVRCELGDIRYVIHLSRLAINPYSHEARSAGSQSFQTGSNPRRRRTAATSAGDRSSLISN